MAIKHKYGAIPTVVHGIKYPSRLEANCALSLNAMKQSNEILFYLRQIPFDLPGNIRHRVDFAVFSNEHVFFIEAKGKDLRDGASKRKMCEDLYGIEIFVARKPCEIRKILFG